MPVVSWCLSPLPLLLRPIQQCGAPDLRSLRIDVKNREPRLFAYARSQQIHAASVEFDLLQLDLLATYRHPELQQGRNLGHVSNFISAPVADDRTACLIVAIGAIPVAPVYSHEG